jgi:hypothetical protein
MKGCYKLDTNSEYIIPESGNDIVWTQT